MDLPSQEVEIPMPLNSAYGGAHVHGHGHVTNMVHQHDDNGHDHHHEPSPNQFSVVVPPPSSNVPSIIIPMTQNHENHNHNHHDNNHHVVLSNISKKQQQGGGGQQVRYRECLKNHAASMGGNATDGCGEFMPSGEEGTIEALTCSACNCHRNFHRKEVEGEISISLAAAAASPYLYEAAPPHLMINSRGRKVINLGHHKNMLSPAEAFGGYPTAATAGALVPAGGGGARSVPIIPYNMGSLLIPSDQSDDQEEGGACRALPLPQPPPPPHHHHQHQYYINHHHNQMLKKRFRTKFTPEQKEKMLNFAEKVGWKIQKQEESVVQQLCQDIGVKRRVLKVWMHNNKHNLAKKNSSTPNTNPPPLID